MKIFTFFRKNFHLFFNTYAALKLYKENEQKADVRDFCPVRQLFQILQFFRSKKLSLGASDTVFNFVRGLTKAVLEKYGC